MQEEKDDSKRGKYSSPDGSSTWEYISAAFCTLGALCIGTSLGWNSPSLAEYMAPDSPIAITPADASTLSAVFFFGSASAPIFSILLIDRVGRKYTILFTALPMMISWTLIIFAKNVPVLIAARFVAGIPVGVMQTTVPIYLSEILSKNRRGSCTGMILVTFHIGVMFMFAIAPHLGVKTTASICLTISLIFLFCFSSVPESPYYLVMKGRYESAEISLEKLRGKTDVADEIELVKATHHEKGKALKKSEKIEDGIKSTAATVKTDQNAFKQLFNIRGNVKALCLGLTLTTIQHYCGFSTIISYCTVIFEAMGSSLNSYSASLIFSTIQIISSIVGFTIADKFGRRTLIIFSGLICSFLLTIIAAYFYIIEHMDIDIEGFEIVPLLSIFSLVFVMNIGIIPVPTLLMGELFATDVKVLATSVVAITGSSMTIFSTKSYLLMATTWGLGHSCPFLTYGITTFVCTIILMKFLPETRGKTLLEIQKELND